MNNFYFHNHQHYGDCLASLHFLIHLSKVNDINCYFNCNQSYHSQLQELIPNNINVFLTNSIHSESFDLWGAKLLHKVQEKYQNQYPLFCKNYPQYQDVFRMCFEMWSCFSRDINLVYPFTEVEEVLFDEELIGKPVDDYYDVLLINSYCLSGQVRYSQHEQDSLFVDIIKHLHEQNKTFITTRKLADYPSTEDNGLSLVKIGQLSKNCKMVVGVPTSPFWISINKWSFKNCDKFINLTHDCCTYDLGSKFVTVNSVEEVLQYI